ncbi:MAG: hypothetical protein ACRCZ9_02535 [Fusobacteriaceae bacterium]
MVNDGIAFEDSTEDKPNIDTTNLNAYADTVLAYNAFTDEQVNILLALAVDEGFTNA